MMGVPPLLSTSCGGDGVLTSNPEGFTVEEVKAAAAAAPDDGDRSPAANRWPRQETLALLRIRSEMDVAFRDSSLKGPLWEEVSRKMGELGYQRNAKKCKEKFENVYKYHKRTKEGRASKPEGKMYKFFDQLEALENLHPSLPMYHHPQARPPLALPPPPPPITLSSLHLQPPHHQPLPSPSTPTPFTHHHHTSTPPLNPPVPPPQLPPDPSFLPPTAAAAAAAALIDSTPSSSSSSTSSDELLDGHRGRKRKWKDFFERLMREVIEKQEQLQKRFLEAIEKREHDRMVREEAWRLQETARMNREHEILVQERSIAAAKDAALIAFLQKISEQHNNGAHPPPPPPPPPHPPPPPSPPPPPPPPPPPAQAAMDTIQALLPVTTSIVLHERENRIQMSSTSCRWPKAEVESLIKMRTNMEIKYQENGPKGPLWEEISAGMRRLGFDRNAKRCKEKWENINKYFKKVKESNKRRPEDSKTCPYFHQLDALYREKGKADGSTTSFSLPLPLQQWPPPPNSVVERDTAEEEEEEEDYEEDDGDEEEFEDDEENDNGGGGSGGGDGREYVIKVSGGVMGMVG